MASGEIAVTPLLHDSTYRESLKARVQTLRPDARRQWGKMTVDQMLWHLNCGLENALGRYPIATVTVPIPHVVLKFVVIRLPWRKGSTPTAPELLAKGSYDFTKEKRKLLHVVDEFTTRPLDGRWADSAFLGPMTGQQWSRLMAKHINHHLQQFSA
jgi:hypothetical protein